MPRTGGSFRGRVTYLLSSQGKAERVGAVRLTHRVSNDPLQPRIGATAVITNSPSGLAMNAVSHNSRTGEHAPASAPVKKWCGTQASRRGSAVVPSRAQLPY